MHFDCCPGSRYPSLRAPLWAWVAVPRPKNPPSILKKAVDRASDVEVSSNINQINQALSMVKSDNDGKAPATIEAAKAAAKVPAEMWVDSVTGLPLEYDPNSGTVHRHGATPNSPSVAGAGGHHFRLPEGSGGY